MADTVPFIQSLGLQDDTGRSRGFKASSSATGNIAGDVADVANELIPAIDRKVRRDIKDEIRGGVSQIFEDFVGVNRESSSSSSVSAEKTMPQDAKKDLASIGKLRRKFEQGKITSTHLHTAAAALAKKIKTRYGGYAEEVDAALRGHGFSPANDILREHLAAQRKAQSSGAGKASALYKSNLRTLDWVMKKGLLSTEDRALVLANPDAAARNPELMGRIRVSSSNEMAKDYSLDQKSKLLSLQASENKLDKDLAKSTLSQQTMGIIYQTVRQTDIWKNYERAQKDLLAATKEGGVANASEIQAVRNSFAAVKTEWYRQRDAMYAKSTWATKSPEAMRDANALFDNYVSTIERALYSGDTNMLQSSTAYLDNLNKDAQIDLATRFKSFTALTAMNKSLGPNAISYMLTRKPEGLQMAEKYLADKMLVDITNNKVETVAEALNAEKNNGNLTGKAADTVLTTVQSVFSQSDSDPQLVRNTFDKMFSKGNEKLLTMLHPSKQEEMNRFLISSQTQKAMKEYVAKGVLTQESMKGYANYVARSYLVTSREDIREAQQMNAQTSTHGINFNQETMKYEVTTKSTVLSKSEETRNVGNSIVTAHENRANDLVSRLNGRIEPLTGIFTEAGNDPKQIIPSLVGVPMAQETIRQGNRLGLEDITPEDNEALNAIVEGAEPPSDIAFKTLESRPELATGPNITLYRNIVTTRDTKAIQAFNKFLTTPGDLDSDEIELIAERAVTGQMNAAEGNQMEVEELRSLHQEAVAKGDKALAKQVKEDIADILVGDTTKSVEEYRGLRTIMKKNILSYLRASQE